MHIYIYIHNLYIFCNNLIEIIYLNYLKILTIGKFNNNKVYIIERNKYMTYPLCDLY